MGREAETQSLQKNNKPLPGRSPGEGNGHPLEYSCLENPMDRGDCRATVLGVAKSWTGLSNEQFKWQQPTVGRSHKVAEWVFSWGARDLNSRSGTSTLRFYKGETSIQNTWLWKLMGSMSKKKKKLYLHETELRLILLHAWTTVVNSLIWFKRLCDDLGGWDGGVGRRLEGVVICILIADSYCCTAESNTL